jgi:hypothetical protein
MFGALSAQATLTVPSTTPGDGVLFTALAAGPGGNNISVTYSAPSGSATTVSVAGTAITVSPKSGETNAGVVAAIQASAGASSLVSAAVVEVSPPADFVVDRAAANLAGGAPQVPAALTVPSTKSGPRVLFTALAAGPAGNNISVAYEAPTGSITTVSVCGTAVTVFPKSGENNAGVVAAVKACPTALSLVDALVVGPLGSGGDLVLEFSLANLAGGAPSVPAVLPVPSTTPHDGVVFTARATGPVGNSILVAYSAPAGSVTAVSVAGTITVSPKLGENNAGVIAAIQTSAAASGLVKATLAGPIESLSDLVVERDAANLAGGTPAAGTRPQRRLR